jgi:hypothetical protein
MGTPQAAVVYRHGAYDWVRLGPEVEPPACDAIQIANREENTDMNMTEHLEQTAHEVEERVRPQIEETTKKLSGLNDQVTNYIKANPGKCLLGALAAGYVIGRIARRK